MIFVFGRAKLKHFSNRCHDVLHYLRAVNDRYLNPPHLPRSGGSGSAKMKWLTLKRETCSVKNSHLDYQWWKGSPISPL
jgi:hypothetical protein